MKFHKRPMDDHEVSFAMSQATVHVLCDCATLSPCNCPPIPTHQIQYDQSTENQNTAHLYDHFD